MIQWNGSGRGVGALGGRQSSAACSLGADVASRGWPVTAGARHVWLQRRMGCDPPAARRVVAQAAAPRQAAGPQAGAAPSAAVATTSTSTSSREQAAATAAEAWLEEALHHRAPLCDSGLPDVDMCGVPEAEEAPPAELGVVGEALTRGRWLLGLLVMQSSSSMVLDSYSDLLQRHLVVTLFLTMLVGAGGNAGNQSAIKVIRGLATGSIGTSWPAVAATLRQQASVGLLLGAGLSAGGWLRVYITNGDATNANAISASLFAIVLSSTFLGTALPFAFARIGVDPAHSGTSIQVLMDILGVAISCFVCNFVLAEFAGSVLQ